MCIYTGGVIFILGLGKTTDCTLEQLQSYRLNPSYAHIHGLIDKAIENEEYKVKPRTRKYHDLSEGESDSEECGIFYRSLRPDEDPLKKGLRPPLGYDPKLTASQHVVAGTKSKNKSAFVSLTRSKKVAAAWAVKTPGGRIAKVKRNPFKKYIDLTQPFQAQHIFPNLKGSSYNTAKASQEVLCKFGMGPESILQIYDTKKLSVAEYNKLKSENKDCNVHFIRSRTTKSSKPQPIMLFPRDRQPVKINHDGHCLFRAINMVQYDDNSDHRVHRLRQMIYCRLLSDPSLYAFLGYDQNIARFRDLTRMETDIVWGGDEEIQIISLLLQRRIIVHNVDTQATLIFDGITGLEGYSSNQRYADIHLHYSAGHYNPMMFE